MPLIYGRLGWVHENDVVEEVHPLLVQRRQLPVPTLHPTGHRHGRQAVYQLRH